MTRLALGTAFALALLALAVPAAGANSPREGLIAYSLGAVLPDPDPEGASQVYTVRPDGTGTRQLTHVPAPEQAGDPAWSPDGRRLLYVSNAGSDTFQVWIMNADGSHQRKLVDDPGFDAFVPRWSADGSQLLFTRCTFVFGFLECTIAVAHTDGTRLVNVTGGHYVEFSAAFDRPNRSIVFSSDRANSLSALWTTTGRGPRRLTTADAEAFWPDVSSGGRLLYTDNFDRPDSRLHTTRADGTHDHTIAAGCFGRWSPTGAHVVYDGGLGCDQGLTVAAADGTGVRTVIATEQLVLADWGPTS